LVDCVEFFNEKLISNYISLCLDNNIRHTIQLSSKKQVSKRLKFPCCKTFPMLLDHLQDFYPKYLHYQ